MNETITELSTKLTYEQITSITQNPLILFLLLGVIWFLPLVIYLLIAFFTRAKTSSGQKLSCSMLSRPNSWIAVIIWTLLQGAFLLLLIFPFWANKF